MAMADDDLDDTKIVEEDVPAKRQRQEEATSSGAVAPDAAADAALADALGYLRRFEPRRGLVGLPWHSSPLVSAALGIRPLFPALLRPRLPGPVVPVVEVVHPVAPFLPLRRTLVPGWRPSGVRAAWMPVRAGRPHIDLATQAEDEELVGALGMWRDLVSDFGDDSKLFRQVAEADPLRKPRVLLTRRSSGSPPQPS